jgi:hypothetical protein
MRKKLKYQGGITKIICQKLAESHKKSFRKLVSQDKTVFSYQHRPIDYDIISFSGAAGFEDQLLSIYSFVHYAGIPAKWVVYSDKSYTQKHIDIFKKEFPFVTVVDWDANDKYVNHPLLAAYVKKHGTAKKVNVVASHNYERRTIFMDSDIVYYSNIAHYLNSRSLQKGYWYVPDAISDVAGFMKTEEDHLYAFNFGFMILDSGFNFDDALTYLEKLNGNFSYFSDQSAFEYAFRKQNGQVLDTRQFIIDTSDQFDFALNYYPDQIALRHYTSPVRHKMWQKGWKWHFQSHS